MRSRRCTPLIGILLASVLSDRSAGQTMGQIPLPNPAVVSSQDQDTQDRLRRDMAKKANEERQEQLKRDTEHLFKLATELKESVEKSNENTLSIQVVRKAEEIEKLAHSVKEKMKGM